MASAEVEPVGDAVGVNAGDPESTEKQFLTHSGPDPNVSYPISVMYCGECSMPFEYCEYYPNYENCKKWLEKNLPEQFENLMSAGDGKTEEGDGEKKRQKRGGKAQVKTKKKVEPQGIKLGTSKRGKRKMVTIVIGLSTYDIDLKDASKFFAQRFSCGSSIAGADEIVIQGDVKDDLFDILPEKWTQIDEDSIDDLGDMKK